MGYPLTVVAVGFGFWAVRRARRSVAGDVEPDPAQPADGTEQAEPA